MSNTCPDCGVSVGELHKDYCDVERCPRCGDQYYSCDCTIEQLTNLKRIPWSGEWPGKAECREYGFYSKKASGKGWIPCGKEEDGATEDLNRLEIECIWNIELQRWVMPNAKEQS